MRILISLLFAVLTYCNIYAQKYVHLYMNDGTFNGFYSSTMSEIKHDNNQNAIITLNGTECIVPLKTIDKIVIEDAYISSDFEGDYRIYEGTFENEFFKTVFVDNRASLFASRNGDFGANDIILYSSAYNNIKYYFFTDENTRIKKIFDGTSLFYFDYLNDVLDEIIQLTSDGDNVDYSLISVPASFTIRKSPKLSADAISFFKGLVTSGANLALGEGAHSDFANNIAALSDNPELHNQMLIVDGLSIAGDIAGIVGSFLAGIPTGGWTWAGIGINLGLLGKDFYGLMNDLFPDSEQIEKYKEYYQNKYGMIIKTINPENVKSNKADIRGTFSALNGVNGNLYFTFSKLGDSGLGDEIGGQLQEVSSHSYIVNGSVSDLTPGTNYFYMLWYDCTIDGLHFTFASENGMDFTTPTPSANTIGIQSTSDRGANVICSFSNVPDGASYGVQYGVDGSSNIVSGSSDEGEQVISISGLEPNTTYSYRAFIKYKENVYYGETKSFTTDPKQIPDLSGTWTFNQAYLGNHTIYPNLKLSSSSKNSATYTASGFYGVISFSMTVSSDGSANIVLSSPYGGSGRFSGKFNDDFTSISGSSYIYDFGPNNWAVPPAEYDEPWSLSR